MQIHRVSPILSTPDMPHPGIAKEEVPIAGFFIRHALVPALFLLLLLQPLSSPAFAMGELVWSVVIKDDAAQLTTNEFTVGPGKLSGTDFPVRYLRIKKFVNQSTGKGESFELRIGNKVAPLFVNPDGTFSESILTFLLPGQITKTLAGKRRVFLGLPDNAEERNTFSLIPACHMDLTEIPGKEILGWERSADGLYSIVHTEKATVFFDATATTPPGLQTIRRRYNHRTFGATMSKDPERVALIAINGHREKIVVFAPDGRLVFEEKSFTDFDYDQLFLTASGETLILDRKEAARASETVAIDLRDGSTKVLDALVEGTRYYSDDGSRLIVLQGGYGKVFYYDSSDPFEPKLLWTRELGHLVLTAAVNRDGSFIAIETTINHPERPARKVIVFDNQGNDFAEPLPETRIEGLQFEGDFLFVGTQRHPIPTFLNLVPPIEIQAFHFPNRQGGRS